MNHIAADRPAAAAMFAEYLAATPQVGAAESPAVDHFGDSPAMANELIALVLSGTKTATASLAADYQSENQPLPTVGAHWVACDGAGMPRAVIRTTEVRTGLIGSVDDAFAFDEGEGDRTRASWLDEHSRFWTRTNPAGFSAASVVVFERFAVVWPLERETG